MQAKIVEKTRGMLNDEVVQVWANHTQEVLDTPTLRLLPYIDYCVKNANTLDRRKINQEEYETILRWERKGYLLYQETNGKIYVTEEFYAIMQAVIFEGYVSYVEYVE